jgi:hypothetical protein
MAMGGNIEEHALATGLYRQLPISRKIFIQKSILKDLFFIFMIGLPCKRSGGPSHMHILHI